MNYDISWCKNTGEEIRKSWTNKYDSGFLQKYCSGAGLDIGGAGYLQNVHAITPLSQIIGLDYPNYNGYELPFQENSIDFIFSSHCLEHIEDPLRAIKSWFRVTKKRGFIVVVVPHRDLYEKKLTLPSRWNADHKRFYTASSLLKEIEDSLPINSYRIRHLLENDEGHDYTDGPDVHGRWNYEIEVVIQKL